MSSERTYLGKIVSIDDPLKLGRARIKVYGIMDGITVEDLPWAEQISGLSFGGDYGGGNITIPRLNSIVSVHFEENNFYKITYHYIKEISKDLKDKLKEDNCYEGTHSLIYDSEAKPGPLKMFYTRKDGLVFELDDAKIQLDTQNDGNLRVVIKMGKDEIRMEDRKVIVNSSNIELGENAMESVIKGDSFKKIYDSHTHPSAGAPPVLPLPSSVLSKTTKTK